MPPSPVARKAPAEPTPEAVPPPDEGASEAGAERRRVVAALLASGLALVILIAFALAWAYPVLAPGVAAGALVIGAVVIWGAARVDRSALAAAHDRLAADNLRLAERLEQLADTAWELHESEERSRRLLDARHRAEAESAAKSRLLATVSHEFRTPLNGILGLTGLLAETPLSPDQATYVRAVHASGESLLSLVDDMLDFSRIEAGRFDLRPESVDPGALIEDVAELLAGRAHAKGIDIAVSIGDAVPAKLQADPARLRQVLVNLAGNGVKFTETGGVVLSVDCDADGRIAFAVSDTGPGIRPEDAERLFGEFEQADSALSRRHGGAGLGLAIARSIVRHMGSDIVLAPVAGGGASFAFALDLPALEPAVPVGRPLAGRSALIVAPGGVEPAVIAGRLAAAGAAVRVARTLVEAAGVAGAAAAADEIHDVILVDAAIGPDPATALMRLREAAGHAVPAAVIVAPRSRSELPALRAAGFDAYLVKPVRRASLLRIVSALVEPGAHGFLADPGDERPRATERPRAAAAHREVLLAEDNEINALLARAVLEGLGHTVVEVRDGAAALEAVRGRATPFGAILMDLHMPGLDGLSAARAIRAHETAHGSGRTPILAVTADVLAETRAEAEAAGINAVVEKPMTPERLRRALGRLDAA